MEILSNGQNTLLYLGRMTALLGKISKNDWEIPKFDESFLSIIEVWISKDTYVAMLCIHDVDVCFFVGYANTRFASCAKYDLA